MQETAQFITEDLVLEPLEGIVIKNLHIKITINEHGTMYIKRGAFKGKVIDVLDSGVKIHFTDLDEHQDKDIAMTFELESITVVVKNEEVGKLHPAVGDEVFVQGFHKNLENC